MNRVLAARSRPSFGMTLAVGISTMLSAPSGCAQPECVPTAEGALRLAAAIDHAIGTGDITAYEALFEPLHATAHAARCAWLRCASGHARWSCSSELLDFTIVAGRGVALLQTLMVVTGPPGESVAATQFGDAPDAGIGAELGSEHPGEPNRAQIRSQRYLVFRAPDAARSGAAPRVGDHSNSVGAPAAVALADMPVALLDIEVDPSHMKDKPLSERAHAAFGCSACNYRVHADETWLLVPHLPERTGCLEAISFYSLLHPITVDLAIQVDPTGADAGLALSRMLAAVAPTTPDRAPTMQDWRPPHYAEHPPRGLSGRRAEVTTADGTIAELHALAFGSVLYLLTVQGRAADLQSQRASIDAILGNFMLRDLELSRQRIDLAPITAHTGGKLEGRDYVNDRARVRFRVPDGFEPRVHCAPGLYHVSWSNPELHRDLSMVGFAPPAGLTEWSREAAWMTVVNSIAAQNDSAAQTALTSEQAGTRSIELDEQADWETRSDGSSLLRLTGRMGDARFVLHVVLDANRAVLTILTARGDDTVDDDELASYFSGFSRG